MTRVHNTWASGASAMPVPGCPFLAASGPSMHKPRMTLIARCSRSVSTEVTLMREPYADFRARAGELSVVEQQDRRGEPVQEAAIADRTDLAGAEHPGGGPAVDVRVD